MSLTNPVVLWGLIGLILIIAELIIPGGIVILLGSACLIVAVAVALGIVEGLVQSLTLWFITSMVLLLVFRQLTQKLVGGDAHIDDPDEELAIFNKEAIVKKTIGPGQKLGRVEFQGTEWPALGDGSEIMENETVRVICRENISLVVEKIN